MKWVRVRCAFGQIQDSLANVQYSTSEPLPSLLSSSRGGIPEQHREPMPPVVVFFLFFLRSIDDNHLSFRFAAEREVKEENRGPKKRASRPGLS